MKRCGWLLGMGLMLLALPGHAAQLALGAAVLLEVELAPGWTAGHEPPVSLVEELAGHLGHELREQGKTPDRDQLLAAARTRLAANEAFIVHDSGAHLDCDASPLDAGAAAPGARVLRQSAEYAAGSLQGEEGVSDFRHRISMTTLAGVEHAVRLEADYRLHDQPRRFVGIITFAAGHWLFLYYTDPLKDPQALPAMETMLKGLRIQERAP